MDLSLIRQTIEIEQLIGDERLQSQVIAETAAPGAGREAIEVLMEDAELSIDAAEAQTDRVVVDGTVYCQAVYRQGENTAARAVGAQTRLNEVVEIPGVTAKSIIRVNGVVEQAEASYENGRMRFVVTVSLRVQALSLNPVEVITQATGLNGLETQFEELCSSKLAAESSADALVREEVALPQQLDARVSLMDWAQARINALTPDLGGVRVQGEVQAEALIGTGISARPVALVKVVMPFESLVELPEWLTDHVTAEPILRRLETEVTPGEEEGETALRLEAEVRVSVKADGQDCATALMDLYGTGERGARAKPKEIAYSEGVNRIDCTEQFRGTLLLPDGAPGVGTVLASRVRPVISQFTTENGHTTVEGALDVKALYLPGGSEQIQSVRGELPFAMKCAGEWPSEAWVRVEATGAEATALMSDRLEVRCTLRAIGFYRVTKSTRIAGDAEESEGVKRPGGIVITWPNASDNAWTIGKKYGLPVKRIREQSEEIEPGKAIVLRM